MIRKIQGFGDLGKIKGIPSIWDVPKRPKRITAERIPLRPRILDRGAEQDKLEAAALQGVLGTLPERIVWKWLVDHQHRFIVQQTEFGGPLVIGGAVVDFVVYDLGRPVALRVQGTYWHGPQFPQRQARDDEQFARLTAMGYHVVDAWEQDIYNAVLNDALTAYIMGEVG
jgi:G:T-mismatch repair DNA endonuclease (very short patch repair protein)